MLPMCRTDFVKTTIMTCLIDVVIQVWMMESLSFSLWSLVFTVYVEGLRQLSQIWVDDEFTSQDTESMNWSFWVLHMDQEQKHDKHQISFTRHSDLQSAESVETVWQVLKLLNEERCEQRYKKNYESVLYCKILMIIHCRNVSFVDLTASR